MPESYTGDEGDTALAAGLPVMDGGEDWKDGWRSINRTRDLIAQRTAAVTTVEKGGTGATTADAARANLGVQLAAADSAEAGKIPTYNAGGQLAAFPPTSGAHVATKAYVDGHTPPAQLADGGTFLSAGSKNLGTDGKLFTGGATAATSGYVVAYINGDGTICKGASTARVKTDITPQDPGELGDIFPGLRRFRMCAGDGSWRYGHIAEELAADPAQLPFVVIGSDGQPESIDFVGLLLAQTAALHQRVAELEARVTEAAS